MLLSVPTITIHNYRCHDRAHLDSRTRFLPKYRLVSVEVGLLNAVEASQELHTSTHWEI